MSPGASQSTLSVGTRLGSFEITAEIGVGGMGVVYRAIDTKLGREVAIKTLPASLTDDKNRLARFEREAKLLASFNHAHIVSIYGFDQYEGTPFLAMELVEGEALRETLRSGPLAVEHALQLALQIAEALEAAHRKGVVHRDLKTANVMVTHDGVVKVLDFGLAKALAVDAGTLTEDAFGRGFPGGLTREGAIQGTPGYMSPEQVRGEAVDARTDIWAFGCMLFEMLSGQPPFERNTVTETLARVLEREPDLDLLPAATPVAIRRLIRRCLEKDAYRRLHHMADARIEIHESLTGMPDETETAGRAARPSRLVWAAFFGAGALATSAALMFWLAPMRDLEEAAHSIRFSIGPLPGPPPNQFGSRYLAVSADGSRIAYGSGERLFEGPIGEGGARIVGNTPYDSPFFRSDGRWLAFANDGSSIWKIAIDGGAAEEITRFEPRFLGGTWRDDTIVFATNDGLFRVSAQGGSPELLIRADDATTYAWPNFVPGTRSILFTMIPAADVDAAQIAWLDLDSLAVTRIRRGVGAQYLPGGFLVYAAGDGLETIAFDPDTRQTRGAPVAVPGVAVSIGETYGNADFAVSDNGTLVTMSVAGDAPLRTMIWVDPATGGQQDAGAPAGDFYFPQISPDGTRVAFDEFVAGDRDIWVFDLKNGSKTNVSRNPGEDLWATWSSDSQRIYFGSTRASAGAWSQIYSRRADGAGPTERLIEDPLVRIPWSVSAHGQVLVFNGVRNRSDIGIVRDTEPRAVQWILADPRYQEHNASLSLEGDFILYESTESGERAEVYLRPFPNIDDGRLQVSVAGGYQPRWAPVFGDTRQIYYQAPNGDMMAAEVDLGVDPPTIENRRRLFLNRGYAAVGEGGFRWTYDVSPVDGRFLMIQQGDAEQTREAIVEVTLNWDEEVKRMARPE